MASGYSGQCVEVDSETQFGIIEWDHSASFLMFGHYCYALNCVVPLHASTPAKRYIEILNRIIPVPQNVTWFENRVIVDVIS